jgi:DNA-binding CsgD family transcriptional regulator
MPKAGETSAAMASRVAAERSLGDRVLAFAKAAPAAKTAAALGEAFLEVIGHVGATRYACLYLKRDVGGFVIERSISNLPRAWQLEYLRRGYDADDPIYQGVIRGAFGYWNEMLRGHEVSRKGHEVMNFARHTQMANGFTKRVHLEGGGVAIIMVAGETIEETAEARAVFRMAFDVFANEGVRLRRMTIGEEPGQADVNLSKSQIKVLRLRAEGLPVKQIAARLGRHPKTIETHVTAIKRRLGAQNMIEAINIATRMNLIQ